MERADGRSRHRVARGAGGGVRQWLDRRAKRHRHGGFDRRDDAAAGDRHGRGNEYGWRHGRHSGGRHVGKGIVAPSALTLPAITADHVSIIAWGSLAARFGIPVSKSHALLAGLAGRRTGRRRLGGAAVVRLAEGRHRPGLLARSRLWRARSYSAGSSLLLRPTHRRRGPSAASTAPKWRRPRSWPSITASTTDRSSWACSR